MRAAFRLTLSLALLLAAVACGSGLKSGDISLSVDKAGSLHMVSAAATTPLIQDAATLSTLTVGGSEVAFGPSEVKGRMRSDGFGKGSTMVLESSSETGLVRSVSVTAYDQYPSTLVVRAVYTNESEEAVAVDGWSMCCLRVNAAGDDPCFWSFQGQSTEERDDWLLPVGDGFWQKNYMGMNNSDYGGGVPVVCLWRRDAGVMIGHLEPNPVLVSLPVSKKAGEDFATISIVKEYDSPLVLQPGESLSTCESFISVFTGDCFSALRNYAKLLEVNGVIMPQSEPDAFEPAWCAWGYERRFTIDEIVGTLPKVKELGFKWATLDDGYQIAEGDWDLTPERFPGGDAQMDQIVDAIHS